MNIYRLLFCLLGAATIGAAGFGYIYDKPACAIALNKMNVIYTGLDNPVTIVVRGVPKDQLKVSGDGVTLVKNAGDNDDYTATATTPGIGYILVSGGDLPPTRMPLRVKRIPDPSPRLGGLRRGGTLGNGEFKAQVGITAVLDNFDFDAMCRIDNYEVTYLGKNQDPVTLINNGARFTGPVSDLVNRATPDDVYFFDNIKCQCPGDAVSRNLGSLVFRIR